MVFIVIEDSCGACFFDGNKNGTMTWGHLFNRTSVLKAKKKFDAKDKELILLEIGKETEI